MRWALTRSSTCVTRLIKTDAQDHRGSLDRHSHHVAALTYSMNTLLQMRMISVSHPLVYTGLSFHWTLPYWKFGFQFSSTDFMTARCNNCFVFINVVSFVLLRSGYKSDSFRTNVSYGSYWLPIWMQAWSWYVVTGDRSLAPRSFNKIFRWAIILTSSIVA